jgi:hypothetical protein
MPDISILADWAEVVGLPIAVIGIIVSVVLTMAVYQRTRRRPDLSYVIDAVEFPVRVEAGDALRSDIEVHYKGQIVGDLSIVRITLKNTGNAPIRKAQVVKGPTFTFAPDTQLLQEPIIRCKRPEDLEVSLNLVPPNTVTLDFDLFGSDEESTIEFVCSGKNPIPEVSARIEGIRQIKLLKERASWRNQVIRGSRIPVALCSATLALSTVAFFWGKPYYNARGKPFGFLDAFMFSSLFVYLTGGAIALAFMLLREFLVPLAVLILGEEAIFKEASE